MLLFLLKWGYICSAGLVFIALVLQYSLSLLQLTGAAEFCTRDTMSVSWVVKCVMEQLQWVAQFCCVRESVHACVCVYAHPSVCMCVCVYGAECHHEARYRRHVSTPSHPTWGACMSSACRTGVHVLDHCESVYLHTTIYTNFSLFLSASSS